MKYREYLISARRHNKACKVLQERIDLYDGQGINDESFKFLVLNLYYLSGYIVECSLKFKIYELFGYSINVDVNDPNECKKVGIDYRKDIRNHNLERLQELLDSKISGFTHKSTNISVDQLLVRWSPDVRYESIELKYSEIQDLYKHINSFMRKM